MVLCPATALSDTLTVSGTSAQFTITMVAGSFYLFTSATACFIAQAANPTAAAADGNMYVPANTLVTISGSMGAKLAVIQASAGGAASLTPTLAF